MKVTKATDNIFEDLGFEKEEAENLKIRSLLMIEISKFIKERKLTQARAAKIFGVSQPRISDLIRGRVDLFTIDALVNLLFRAGIKVTITLDQAA